jgi:hypothetical protein
MMSGAVYGWWNNDNNNTSNNTMVVNGPSTLATNADVRSTYGFEASGGIRGFGFSGDIEYQHVHGKLLNQNFTGGIYENAQIHCQRRIHGLPRRVGSRGVILYSGCQQLCERLDRDDSRRQLVREKVRDPVFGHL